MKRKHADSRRSCVAYNPDGNSEHVSTELVSFGVDEAWRRAAVGETLHKFALCAVVCRDSLLPELSRLVLRDAFSVVFRGGPFPVEPLFWDAWGEPAYVDTASPDDAASALRLLRAPLSVLLPPTLTPMNHVAFRLGDQDCAMDCNYHGSWCLTYKNGVTTYHRHIADATCDWPLWEFLAFVGASENPLLRIGGAY
jgi:hypothetical protein